MFELGTRVLQPEPRLVPAPTATKLLEKAPTLAEKPTLADRRGYRLRRRDCLFSGETDVGTITLYDLSKPGEA